MTMLSEPIATSTLKKMPPNPHQLFPSEIEEMQSQEHNEICAYFVVMAKELFAGDENANVGGDQGFYWNNEDDRDLASPDAYLIRNAGKAPRKSWKLWEERNLYPNLSIEFLLEAWSEGNALPEKQNKFMRYQTLGAKEFFQLDYPEPMLFGHRLNESGVYELIAPSESGRLFSEGLQAELAFEDGLIRLYRDGKRVLTLREAQAELKAALAELEQLKRQLGR